MLNSAIDLLNREKNISEHGKLQGEKAGFRVQGSGFRVQGSGIRDQGSGVGVQRQGSVEFGVRSVVWNRKGRG